MITLHSLRATRVMMTTANSEVVTAVPEGTQPIAQPLVTAAVVAQPAMTAPVQHTPSSSSIVRWGKFPIRVICTHCKGDVTTSCDTQAVLMTHVACCVLCAVGCWPCACIPYFSDSCKGVVHSCPSCRQQLGASNPMN